MAFGGLCSFVFAKLAADWDWSKPWQYRGLIMEVEGERNNHHSIVEFKGQWILFYHRWLPTDSPCGEDQRYVCAEYIYFNEDGTIQPVTRTKEGVSVPPVGKREN